MTRVSVAATVLALVATLTPASALARDPGFRYPWRTGNDNIVVQAQGVAPRWELPAVLHEWNRKSRVIHVHFGRCDRFPRQHCVIVRDYRANDSMAGYTNMYLGTELPARINLNRRYWPSAPGSLQANPRATTCHEFGHAVGFDHPSPSGCTSGAVIDSRHLSRWMVKRADRAYRSHR